MEKNINWLNIVLVPTDIDVVFDWFDDDCDGISENWKLHYYQVKALIPFSQCSSTFL